MVERSEYEAEWIGYLLGSQYRYHEFSTLLTSDLDQLVSRLCQKLSMSIEIEFTCLVNIHSFFDIYLQRFEYLRSELQFPLEQQQINAQTMDHVESQTALFIMNVIHICAKYVENTHETRTNIFLKLLADCCRPSEVNYFKQIEFEVFQLIDFRIEPPVAFYCAVYFMKVCLHEMHINDTKIYPTLKELLRISCLFRSEIYKWADLNIISNIYKYQSDQALLGLANVVTTFIVLKFPTQIIRKLLNILVPTSGISGRYIIFLASRITLAIQKNKSSFWMDNASKYY